MGKNRNEMKPKTAKKTAAVTEQLGENKEINQINIKKSK